MGSLVSIIIPSYNRANSLAVAIESVLDQTSDNWELIIIDDGSTDTTYKLLGDYLDNPKVRYYYQENSGVAAARNCGASKANGDYLLFLDSDDSFLPGLLQRLEEIEFSKYDIICWEVLKNIDGKSLQWKPVHLEKIYNHITASFLAGSICYKKEIFVKAGGFDPFITFGENYELGIRISRIKNLRVRILNETFLLYNLKTTLRESNSIQNKLGSNEYLLAKHKKLYIQDPLSHARLVYQIGLLNQQTGNFRSAQDSYRKAWKIKPDYLKPLLRFLYLKGKSLLVSKK